MPKKVIIVTSGRWDFGHLYPVIKAFQFNESFVVKVIAPENHNCLSDDLLDGTTFYTLGVRSILDYGVFFNDVFSLLKGYTPDFVVLLGDRFEIHAAATAATLLNIPIAHIHGGEVTTGSFDNELRNSITMMAKWHFTSHIEYAHRIAIMLGLTGNIYYTDYMEDRCYQYCMTKSSNFQESHIYNVGAPGIDSLLNIPPATMTELERMFTIDFKQPFVLALFNPVTKEQERTREYITNLLNALYRYGEQVIMIKPNIDPGNEIIREQIYNLAARAFRKWDICENIPRHIFMALMLCAHMMVGNSSAGIYEAAYLSLPVVNIGTRQEGRIKPLNVINCDYSSQDIFDAMCLADGMSKEIENGICSVPPLFGEGDASKKIVEIMEKELCPIQYNNASGCGTDPGV
jgi:UDP-N-acetylglucosamine 2-epimerase